MRYIFCFFLFPLFLCAAQRDLAHSALIEVGKILYAESGLYPKSAKQWVAGGIDKLGLTVEGYREMDIESARILATSGVDRFLTVVNNEKPLRPFLATYPFSLSHIELEIRFKKPSYDAVSQGALSKVVIRDGHIRYYVDEGYFDSLVREEPYPEPATLTD